MMKQLRYILAFLTIINLHLDAVTHYTVGLEIAGERTDSILMGSSGDFNNFINPSPTCKALYINLAVSASEPGPNVIQTNSYTGIGTPPSLPATLEHLYIYGDASFFDTMVLGNEFTGPCAPTYPSAAYALPTPAEGTTVHFSLTKRPASNPRNWFQGPLPADCKLVIELGSQDPYVNTMLPLGGGAIVIGAPTDFLPGFSGLLNSAAKPVIIQSHPGIEPNLAYQKALVTLWENMHFAWGVWGISLKGAYQSSFRENSQIADPQADTAEAGFLIASGKKLSIYSHDHRTLPAIDSAWGYGGASTEITKKPAPLPIKSVRPC